MQNLCKFCDSCSDGHSLLVCFVLLKMEFLAGCLQGQRQGMKDWNEASDCLLRLWYFTVVILTKLKIEPCKFLFWIKIILNLFLSKNKFQETTDKHSFFIHKCRVIKSLAIEVFFCAFVTMEATIFDHYIWSHRELFLKNVILNTYFFLSEYRIVLWNVNL